MPSENIRDKTLSMTDSDVTIKMQSEMLIKVFEK